MLPLVERAFGLFRRSDPHFVVVPRLKAVYGRIPKAANSAIRGVLARHVDRNKDAVLPPNTDRFWSGTGAHDTALVDAAEVERRFGDHFVFSVVRNPFDRLVSCWSDMIDMPRETLPALARLGFEVGMGFPDFVDKAASIPDAEADLHFRSQASMLTRDGRVVPSFVGRYEALDRDWAEIRTRIRERSGIDVGDLPQRNVRRRDRSDVPLLFADRRLVAIVLERYADDFRLFYPDRREPVAGPPVPRV